MDPYFQALAGLTLPRSAWAGQIGFIARVTRSAKKYYNIIGHRQHIMTISNKQTSLFGADELTSLQAGFPASHTATQASDLAPMMSAISGQKCVEQLERLNRATWWQKTFTALLIGTMDWSSRRCRLTWKLKGTPYKRTYCQLRVLAHPTNDTECGLWPTPTAMQVNHPERVAKLKATGATSINSRKAGNYRPNSVLDMAMFIGLIPTPTQSDYKGGRTTAALEKTNRKATNSLPDYFAKDGETSQLNPRFLAEMMGFPTDWTELPYLNGNAKA